MTDGLEHVGVREELLLQWLHGTAARSAGGEDDTGIATVPRGGPLALSSAQRRMWILEQLRPGSTEYVTSLAVRLTGVLDESALRTALDGVSANHEVLRTRYAVEDGEPVALVDPPAPVPVRHTDLRHPAAADRDHAVAELVALDRGAVDLAEGPVFLARLVATGDGEHLLLLTTHHIATDARSENVLLRELRARYAAATAGSAPPVAAPRVGYADFAAWQRERLSGGLDHQLAYWREQLAGTAPVALPTDRPRPPVRDAAGDTWAFTVAAPVADALRALAREHRATPFMVLLAAFGVLLARHSGQRDIAVGVPVAGRDRPELSDTVGLFLNTLVLRTDLSGDPAFAEALGRVRETAMAAFANRELPFEHLVDVLDPARDPSANPLFSTMFVWHDAESTEAGTAGGLTFRPVPLVDTAAKVDLTLSVTERPDGTLGCAVVFATALFDRATVERLAGHYVRLLAAVAADPHVPVGDLDLLGGAERHRLLTEWNDTATAWPEATLPELLTAQALSTPDAVAVRAGTATVTYAELHSRAGRMAHRLRGLGVGPETVVGVHLHRGVDAAVALLAVWQAGGVYLPLDPDLPAARRDRLAATAGAHLVLDGDAFSGLDDEPDHAPEPGLCPDNAAYVVVTSGSTGAPKGVLVSHRAIVNRIRWTQETCRLDGGDRVLQKTPHGFDVSLWEYLWPLTTGATMVVARPGGHRDPAYLAELIARERVTTVHFVPSVLRAFLAEPFGALPSLRRMICSGEALTADLVTAVHDRIGCELHNLYGPTEAAVDVTAIQCVPGEPVTIGRPVANTRAYIVDRDLRPVPIGVPGELALAGVQLARGYLGAPGHTAERFVPDPFGDGERLYRTGDLARHRPDGTIEYLGRLDRQVKINGHRVEPGEVEAVLAAHPDVTAAAVTVHDGRLAAYVVASGTEAVREHLRGLLPEPMVPAYWTTLDALPLTPSGKTDHAALPAPVPLTRAATGEHVAPRDATEQLLADAVAAAIGIDAGQVGVHDSFFTLGGDSMRAIRVVGALRADGIDLAVHDLFTHRTVAELAALAARGGTGAPAAAVAPFAQLDEHDRALVPGEVVDAYPMAETQAGMVYEMLSATSATYQNVSCYRIRDEAPFDVEVLRAAVRSLVDRHEILRTSFDLSTYSEAVQLVHATAELPVCHTDLRGADEETRRAVVRDHLLRERTEPFDVTAPPLVRHHVHQVADDEWLLTHTECHAVLDGWSQTALVAELVGLYRGLRAGHAPAPVTPPGVRFADFVAAESRSLESGADHDFWAGVVAGTDKLSLPAAWAGGEPGEPVVVRVDFDDLEPRLRVLAAEAGASLKSVLHAAHLTALSVVTGTRRFRTGLVMGGRPEVARADEVHGMYLNTVPFAADTTAPTWRELVARVFATETALLPHRRYPMPAMAREWGDGSPLVDVAFVHLDFHVLDRDAGVAVVDDFSPSELPFAAITFPGYLHLAARPDRVGRAHVELLARTYRHVLATMAADPGAVRAAVPAATGLAAADRERALPRDNVRDYPTDRLAHELVAAHAAATPDAAALCRSEHTTSFGELDRAANRLAHRLVALGVGPDVVVGLHLGRTPELVAAQLAVWKAGGAFLPLDPELPASRLRHMVADAGASVVLTAGGGPAGAVPAGAGDNVVVEPVAAAATLGLPDTDPAVPVDPDTLAYVIFTSGSTGRPKGVAVSHRAALNLRHAHLEHLDVRPGDRVLQFASPSYDVSVWELMALTAGAALVLPPAGADPGDLRAQAGVTTHMTLPPAMLGMLSPGDFPALRVLVSGGDVLPGAEAARWAGHVRVLNAYGPTETAVCATITEVPDGADDPWPPIGTPLGNVRAYVLDADHNPLPDGVPGDLHLAGAGLARGYLGRPARTAEVFLPDPFGTAPGARMYRTGDVVSRTAGGVLRYHGRRDHQVKVRGVRIELGEVEQTLTGHPGVDAAVVTVHRPGTRDATLVAHTRPADGPSPAELREYLRARLPRHLVPSRFVAVAAFPLTASGKVDRAALPSPDDRQASAKAGYVAPRSAVEEALAGAWAAALHLDRVGVHDDFFDLGGHSLAMMRIITRVRDSLGLELTFRSFLEHPTIAGQVPGLDAPAGPARALTWLRRDGDRAPLFCVHPGGGSAHWYQRFLPYVDADIPVAAFEWPELHGDDELPSVQEMAGRHYAELRAARPHGPYRLFAWCGGSTVAAEMAGRLVAEGETVTFVLLDPVLDGNTRANAHEQMRKVRRLEYLVNLIARAGDPADTPANRAEILALYDDVSSDIDEDLGMDLPERGVGAAWPRTVRIWRETMEAIVTYPHRHFAGRLHIIVSDALADGIHVVVQGQTYQEYLARWDELAGDGVDVHRVPGDHGGVMRAPLVANVCAVVNAVIGQAEAAEAEAGGKARPPAVTR